MGVLLAALALSAAKGSSAAPILWVNPEGKVFVSGKVYRARLTPGASTVKTPFGYGLDFDGTHGGLLFPDLPQFALTDSMTISAWVNLRGYVQAGPGAQIFFRGDDRLGLDPYSLSIHPDGNIAFMIDDGKGGADQVLTHAPLNKWFHVTASFDTLRSEAKLYIDGRLVDSIQTLRMPMMRLSSGDAPGIGIGNVQNDKGPHNQPLKGTVADVRLYDVALTPAEVGWHPYKEQ